MEAAAEGVVVVVQSGAAESPRILAVAVTTEVGVGGDERARAGSWGFLQEHETQFRICKWEQFVISQVQFVATTTVLFNFLCKEFYL